MISSRLSITQPPQLRIVSRILNKSYINHNNHSDKFPPDHSTCSYDGIKLLLYTPTKPMNPLLLESVSCILSIRDQHEIIFVSNLLHSLSVSATVAVMSQRRYTHLLS